MRARWLGVGGLVASGIGVVGGGGRVLAAPSPLDLAALANAVLVDVDRDGVALAAWTTPDGGRSLVTFDPITGDLTEVIAKSESGAIVDTSGEVIAAVSASVFGGPGGRPALALADPVAGTVDDVTPAIPDLASTSNLRVTDVDAVGRFVLIDRLVTGRWEAGLVDLVQGTFTRLGANFAGDTRSENLTDDGATALIRVATSGCPACWDLYTVPTAAPTGATRVSLTATGAPADGVYRGQISGDGSTVAFIASGWGMSTASVRPAGAGLAPRQVVLRNLRTGANHVVEPTMLANLSLVDLAISGDGSAVAFAHTTLASSGTFRQPPLQPVVYRADCEQWFDAAQADVPGAVEGVALADDGVAVWYGYSIGGIQPGFDGPAIYGADVPACPTAFAAKAPVRMLDTRRGGVTIDARQMGAGTPAAGQRVELQLAGRRSIPFDAKAVVLNVTVTGGVKGGYVTAWPCDTASPPDAFNFNFMAGRSVPNLVIVPIDARGMACLQTSESAADLIADLAGYFPAESSYRPTAPTRLLDTRPGTMTVDRVAEGQGLVPAATKVELPVRGRAGVGADAAAVVLNTTVTGSTAGGYVTVWPCDVQPNASNLNFPAGADVPNLVVAPVSPTGTVCLWSSAPTHMISDLAGWFPAGSGLVPITPTRLLDERPGAHTVDERFAGAVPRRQPNGTTVLKIAGRGGMPAAIGAVVLNVTAAPTSGGYATVWPCQATAAPGGARIPVNPAPNASNLNFETGRDIANLVIAPVNADGEVCVATFDGYALLIADASGWFPV